MTFAVTIALCAAGVLLISLLIKLLKAPIRWAFKLLINALMGFAALFLVNILGSFVGLSLGINWLNAIITGTLGLPGLVLLLLIKYLF